MSVEKEVALLPPTHGTCIKRIEVQLSVHEEVAGNSNVAIYRRSKSKHVSPAAEQGRERVCCVVLLHKLGATPN